jgi:hypothetical protein
MRDSSLEQRFDVLCQALLAKPISISPFPELPFAIFRYDPGEEWAMRLAVGQKINALTLASKRITKISLAELMWASIERSEGLDVLLQMERQQGFAEAQRQVTSYLSESMWTPLADLVAERADGLDPERDILFLVRAAALAPSIYPVSRLMDDLKGKTEVPGILFYPGTSAGPNNPCLHGAGLQRAPPQLPSDHLLRMSPKIRKR